MSLMQKQIFLICLLLCSVSSAIASCQRTTVPTFVASVNFGRIIISPDLQVGDLIASKQFETNTGDKTSYYTCQRGTYTFSADITHPGATDTGNKIYSTNIEGIGLRFTRVLNVNNTSIVYPDEYSATILQDGQGISLNNSMVKVEIFKTGPITGSGTITSGNYTTYGLKGDSNPMLITAINADAIAIVSPSCTVLSDKNMNVYLDPIAKTQLNGVGTFAGGKDFDIDLQCSGGVSATGYANVNSTFSGELAEGTTEKNGVLKNEASDAIAKGIGIQVLKNGNPLEFNSPYNVGVLNSEGSHFIKIPLFARYYQYARDSSTGKVESKMIFNLTYD